MRVAVLSLLVLLFLGIVSPKEISALQGVTEKQRTSEVAELIDAYNELLKTENSRAASRVANKDTAVQGEDTEHEELKRSLRAFIVKRMEYENTKAENAKRVVYWSNVSANLTFVIAHLFLLFGLFAGYRELRHAGRLRSQGKAESVELEIGLEKIALKTSLYGVLVLFLSFFFYFLYLKFVYPVIVF